MSVPCVAVPRERGEAARQALAEADLLDGGHEIVVEEGTIYLPVIDQEAVPEEYADSVTTRELPRQEPQRTPADLLGYEPTYERLGDIVILDEDDPDRASEIARAVVDSDVPVRTVVNRNSKIRGELRVRDWEVLIGPGETGGQDPYASPTETVHREYGYEYLVDIAEVYFSPRLATERHRVVDGIDPGEHVFDMFAGVGPFAIPAADRGASVVACDLNERAIHYLRENARRNDVADRITAIHGDVREVASEWEGWADRIVMNLPHTAGEFLDTAVDLAAEECLLHYYDIQGEDDPFGPGEAAIREAAAGYEVTVETRHVVRSYAPHELNVCLDVRLTGR
ncbi:MAG: class I SAM-dependent methyltransferase family protein [Haloferacaceae archaeon]